MLIRSGELRSTAVLFVVVFSLFSPLSAATLADVIADAKTRYQQIRRGVNDITIIEETKIVAPGQASGSETNDSLMKIYRKGDRFRIESTVMSSGEAEQSPREKAMASVIIYDGRDTWMMTPMFGKTRVPRQEVRQFDTHADWWDTLVRGARITGTETVDTIPCYVIDNSGEGSALFQRLWVDTANYRLLRALMASPRTKEYLLVQFSDFRDIKGITEIPYTVTTFSDNKPVTRTTVKQVAINTGLPDNLFDPGTIKSSGPNYMERLMKELQQKQAVVH